MRIEFTDKDTAEDIIEQGVGLIARGLYRLNLERGPETAAADAKLVRDHFASDWLEFTRQAEEAKRK
jgi:hypothetical protein